MLVACVGGRMSITAIGMGSELLIGIDLACVVVRKNKERNISFYSRW